MIEFLVFTAVFIGLIPILGTYMANVFTGNSPRAYQVLGWLENFCYRIGGVNPKKEMSWKKYGKVLFSFNFLGFIFLFILQMLQGYLPLNPQHFDGVAWPLAYNTAMSFTTNTDWQAYAGETTLSYFTQMVGLTSLNFLSAATGMAALLALTRGLIQKNVRSIGNFWEDLVRMVVYLLLPLSILMAIVLVGQGVIQNFSPYIEVSTLEKRKQTIPFGPVASQVAIKQLGSNGGGFFNANSTHPFENPTPFSNFLEIFAIILIPAASVYMYGLMIGSKKHAHLLFCAMLFFWILGIFISIGSEQMLTPYPYLEGKETRFGLVNSVLWSNTTTAIANGSVNAMISSLSPFAGGIALVNLLLGGLIFGGIGVGLCSMIMLVLLTVFLSGLMVGRTPEYLGKKIEKKEMQWVMMAVLMPSALILIGAGISVILPNALLSLGNTGPHGLTEIIYAFSSAAANNGSAFAGLDANTTYYNLMLGSTMLLGRIAIILPSLAIAGLLASKKIAPPSSGTFSTDSFLFFIVLISAILIFGALAFFPALSLGPIVEHLLMLKGETF